jgi:hypothetical protein
MSEEGIREGDAGPGRTSSPQGDDRASVADRVEPGTTPPGANQGKNEPFPASREESGEPAPDRD